MNPLNYRGDMKIDNILLFAKFHKAILRKL